jgi:hypothetical protein
MLYRIRDRALQCICCARLGAYVFCGKRDRFGGRYFPAPGNARTALEEMRWRCYAIDYQKNPICH